MSSYVKSGPLAEPWDAEVRRLEDESKSKSDTVARIALMVQRYDGSNHGAIATDICNMIFVGELLEEGTPVFTAAERKQLGME